jgi:hypothetical protein
MRRISPSLQSSLTTTNTNVTDQRHGDHGSRHEGHGCRNHYHQSGQRHNDASVRSSTGLTTDTTHQRHGYHVPRHSRHGDRGRLSPRSRQRDDPDHDGGDQHHLNHDQCHKHQRASKPTTPSRLTANGRISGFGLLSTTATATPFERVRGHCRQVQRGQSADTADTPLIPFQIVSGKARFTRT